MASTAPAKSQPLHNFSLPHWKWPKSNHHHRGRRSPPSSSAPPRESPAPIRGCVLESESACYSSSSAAARGGSAHEGRRSPAPEPDLSGGAREVRSKILIRLSANNKPDDEARDEGRTGSIGDGKTSSDAEIEELAAKSWNLRPRKPIGKQSNGNGGASLPESRAQPPPAASVRSDLVRLRTSPDTNVTDKKEKKKQKFSIPLTRAEIEEDIFSITGSKPARRPKKRSKTVQKQLDNVFPGLWLASITPDSYKVSEAPGKG